MLDNPQTPPGQPPKGTQRLETDAFCAGCGYNLHGQNVWRDEKLEIMVCRCPECGRHHPAGLGVTASSVWLNRLGFTLLVNWIAICLLLLFAGGGIWFGMQIAYLENFTRLVYLTPDGQIAERISNQLQIGGGPTYVIKGTNRTVPIASPARIYHSPIEWSSGNQEGAEPLWEAYMPFVLVNFFDSIILGVLIAAAFFHLRHRAYFLIWLPIVPALIAYAVFRTEVGTETMLPWIIGHISAWCGYDIAILALGIVIGRPVIRFIVSLIIPPKPRQYFAFLWMADGKKFPSTINPSAMS